MGNANKWNIYPVTREWVGRKLKHIKGVAHGEGAGAFWGGVALPDGRVVFVPYNSRYIGIYDTKTRVYTRGPVHRRGMWWGGVLAGNGEVIFIPGNSAVTNKRTNVLGVYNPDKNTYRDGPTYDVYTGSSAPSHQADQYGVTLSNGGVLLPKNRAKKAEIYYPDTDTIERIDNIYDADTGEITSNGISSNDTIGYGTGILLSDGRLLRDAGISLQYKLEDDSAYFQSFNTGIYSYPNTLKGSTYIGKIIDENNVLAHTIPTYRRYLVEHKKFVWTINRFPYASVSGVNYSSPYATRYDYSNITNEEMNEFQKYNRFPGIPLDYPVEKFPELTKEYYIGIQNTFAAVDVGGLDFFGCAKRDDGKVILAPHDNNCIGVIDLENGTYTLVTVPGLERFMQWYKGAVLSANNTVVFVPHNSPTIDVYV